MCFRINGNAHKVTFWVFAYMLHDAQLLERIRQEVAPGVVKGALNVPFFDRAVPQIKIAIPRGPMVEDV